MNLNTQQSGSAQLQAIQAMLSSGHASIRLERHTFMLWGLAAASLILLVPRLISLENFPDHSQRMWLQTLLISQVLLATGVLDTRWTARARSRRDQTISFIQRQITKLWWLLIALVVVINIGMSLYGGGYFFYGITLVLTGIGIYVHGLFSRQMLTWSGALQILLGLVLIATSPEIDVQEWVAISAFGIGFPAFALMVDRIEQRNPIRELLLSLAWLSLVLIPAFTMVTFFHSYRFDDWRKLSWDAYLDGASSASADPAVVTLPAGSLVPVSLHITGDLLVPVEQPQPLMMVTTKPVDLALSQDGLRNMVRIGEGDWRSGYDYRIERWQAQGSLSPSQGASLDVQFNVRFER